MEQMEQMELPVSTGLLEQDGDGAPSAPAAPSAPSTPSIPGAPSAPSDPVLTGISLSSPVAILAQNILRRGGVRQQIVDGSGGQVGGGGNALLVNDCHREEDEDEDEDEGQCTRGHLRDFKRRPVAKVEARCD